jgi:hypothetical protein
MSGMEVTKRTLLSTNRVYGPVAPAPIRPGYTQSARDIALGQPGSAGPALGARPVALSMAIRPPGTNAACSPPADTAPTRLGASCCYQFGRLIQAATLLAVIATEAVVLPRCATGTAVFPDSGSAPPSLGADTVPDGQRGTGQCGASSAQGASSRSAPAGFSPGSPSPVSASPPIWNPDDCLIPRPPNWPAARGNGHQARSQPGTPAGHPAQVLSPGRSWLRILGI